MHSNDTLMALCDVTTVPLELMSLEKKHVTRNLA